MLLFETYHYVPPCPHCGSRRTGRYVYSSSSSLRQHGQIIVQAMKKGELCRVKCGFDDCSQPNMFCEDCEAEWFGLVDTYPCNSKRIKKEIRDRDISLAEIKEADNRKSIWQRIKKKAENATEKKKAEKRAQSSIGDD